MSPLDYADQLTVCERTLVTYTLIMENMNECESMQSYADISFTAVVFSVDSQEFSNNLSTRNVGLEPLIFFCLL